MPNDVWKCFFDWYGGGPEFLRKVIYNNDGKKNIELYPPMLYMMQTKEDGTPNDSSIIPYLFSNKSKIKEVTEIMKKKFQIGNEEVRIWYRLRATSHWKLAISKETTIEDNGLSYGDKLLLESKLKTGWPREKISKDEPQWDSNDKVDVYMELEKCWKEGKIVANKQKCFVLQVGNDSNITIPKNSTLIAPYRSHTGYSFASILSPDQIKNLSKEFKSLANLGNTYIIYTFNINRCYMNTILQCIVHTPLLKNYFHSGIYQNHINPKVIKDSKEVFADAVSEFFKEYIEKQDATASLRRLKNSIGKCIHQFQGYEQHDAQEV